MIWSFKNLLQHNKLILKFFSCVIAYIIWVSINQLFQVTITKKIPVVIYQTDDKKRYHVQPEHVTITLQASRAVLKLVNLADLAIHIKEDELIHEKNILPINNQSLLLPPDIHVVHSTPSFITAGLMEIT